MLLDAVATGLRALHVAALVMLFGGMAFRETVGPCPIGMLRLSWLAVLLAGAGWLAVQAALFARAGSIAAALTALEPTALQTRFGRVLLVRLFLLLPVFWLSERRAGSRIAVILTGVALALQPLLGHPGASDDAVLVAAAALHVLGAGVWLGALPALAIALRNADAATAGNLAHGFGRLGVAGVGALLFGAAGQAWTLGGTAPAWIGSVYGRLMLAKLVLLLGLLATAAVNRYRLTPRQTEKAARRMLGLTVAVEIELGLVVLALAAVLAGTIPGAHVQPDWPFAWRPSLVALAEPELRAEFGLALLGLGLGMLAAVVILIGFRRRLPAAIIAMTGLIWAWPTATLLWVPAWPTSFWLAPTPSPAQKERGAALFSERCAACHGAEGRGDGPAASRLRVPPADLTAEHLWEHLDGELYWRIAHGVATPQGDIIMPAQSDLAEDDVWALVAYVRAANPYAAQHRRVGHRH